jgi:transporter, anaerobic C4-dicarboxylate uptake C (dcuC) family
MFAIIIGLIVIALVVTLLLKGYYPQAILFMGGVVLLTCTAIFGWGDLLNAKQTTNFIGFDIFKVFSTGFSSRIAGLGLTLMAIGGFSRYMEHVGASAALFSVFEKPLKLIKSPYVLLGASFLVSQIMVIFVPSHAGLALLLMVTLYPILIRSGVSPMSALGVIGYAQFVDVGPGSGNAILAAQTAGVDVSEYFVYYQLPLFVGVVIILTFVHMFVQRWWDKREGWVFDPNNIQTLAGAKTTEQDKKVPKIYAILPIIPLFLIIFFSKVAGSHIRMDVVTAMGIYWALLPTMLVTMYFAQKYWDKREGLDPDFEALREKFRQEEADDTNKAPKIYALLTVLPLFLLLTFNPIVTEYFGLPTIKLGIPAAVIITIFVSMIFEYIRKREFVEVMASMKVFFEGMGKYFAVVVTLIVAGQVFGKGLTAIGAVNALIAGAESMGLGVMSLIIVMGVIIGIIAFLMGSGNAPFYSFASIAPAIAEKFGVHAADVLLPLQTMTGFGRTMSPVTGGIVAVAGMAGVSPFRVVKRNMVPLLCCCVVNFLVVYLFILP